MNPAFDLTGQTALITGGGTGLGLGMAKCLAASGAKVILVGRRKDELTKAAESLGSNAFALVGDVYGLDEAEQAAVTDTVTQYNALIQAEADTLGWAYVDPNPALVALKEGGQIPLFPDLTQPSAAFGAYFTLDGVHPSGTAHIALVNLIIDAVNAKYGTNISHAQ